MKRQILLSILLALSSLAWAGGQEWSGHWHFDESWPAGEGVHNFVSYDMNIRPHGNEYTVDIDIDGFQTMQRIRAEGKVIGQNLRIVFQSVRPDHHGVEYQPGDVLLELTEVKGKVLTTWRKIEPSLLGKKTGVYFKKAR
jgi:hypothetical protein